MAKLSDFKGNTLSDAEKEHRLSLLERSIELGEIDAEFIPWLRRLNAIDGICTTQCCTGHDGREVPHVDFRSALPPGTTLNILREAVDPLNTITVALEDGRLRYVVWFGRETWEKEVERLTEALEAASQHPVEGWDFDRPSPDVHDVRRAFKELSVEDQRVALGQCMEEHNYYRGVAGKDFFHAPCPKEFESMRQCFREGLAHREGKNE